MAAAFERDTSDAQQPIVQHDAEDKTELLDPLVMRAQARVGRVLKEKWRLDVLLGVGGMAAVYAATHRNGSRCAIKVLHPELSVSADVRTRFLREGYAANAVGHDGVVRVSDDDIAEDGSAFLVMELLDGETLEERRKRSGGRLTEDEVLSVADALLDVLAAAHPQGIVHRDLKPENIFLTRDGHTKVLDFGIARLRAMSSASHATQAGFSMGTPSYMPPEQARGLWDQVDGRSDLWAVGATMFALLTGTEVHAGRTANEVLITAATQPARPLASVVPEVSPAVARVVDRALAFEREQRWQDAATMQEAVRAAFHDRHGAPISTAPRLLVPATVANRTLASAAAVLPSPGAPSTNGAVATSHVGVSQGGVLDGLSARLPRPTLLVLGVGTVVVALVIGATAALVSREPESEAPSVAGGTTTSPIGPEIPTVEAAPSALVPPPAAPPPNVAPTVAVSDLPREAEPALDSTKAVSKSKVPDPAAAPSATAPSKPAKSNCTPPYSIDPATGAKRWKVACF